MHGHFLDLSFAPNLRPQNRNPFEPLQTEGHSRRSEFQDAEALGGV